MERAPLRPTNPERDRAMLARPVAETRAKVLQADAPNAAALTHNRVERDGRPAIDVFTTVDNRLTILVEGVDGQQPQVSHITSPDVNTPQFHYRITGDTGAVTIMGAEDPIHGVDHVVEIDGAVSSSHFGAVEVFDAKTQKSTREDGKPVSRKLTYDIAA